MVELSRYKDRPMMVIKNEILEAGFLYEDGGKLVSLKDVRDGQEFLAQATGEEYLALDYDGDYVSSECSGFDDMFPTIDPYTPESGPFAGKTYPDHGEVCRVPMEIALHRNAFTLSFRSDEFRYTYQKDVSLLNDGSLEIVYHIRNTGTDPFPALWAGHCMCQGVDGAQVFTSYGPKTPRVVMFGPDDEDPNTLPTESLTGYKPGEGWTYKFYYLEKMPEGRFGIRYPDGKKLCMQVDFQKVPYLGVWFNNGAFKDMYNIALEPCTAPYDAPDRAEEHGYETLIQPGQTVTFVLKISIQKD